MDKYENCNFWAQQGSCVNYWQKGWMKQNCPMSCQVCRRCAVKEKVVGDEEETKSLWIHPENFNIKHLRIWKIFVFEPLTPLRSLQLRAKLWSAITPEWIGLTSQWKHPWMQKTARNPMSLRKSTFAFEIKKSIFLYLTYWFLGTFHRKSKNSFTASLLAFSIRFFRFNSVWRPQKYNILKQFESGLFLRGNLGEGGWVGSLHSQMTLWGTEKQLQDVIIWFVLLNGLWDNLKL